jgi:hypothetical protein
MIAQDVIFHKAVTFDDLKPLTSASGPCITMTVPLPNSAEIEVRLKNAIRGIQKKFELRAGDTHNANLMAPIEELATTGFQANSLSWIVKSGATRRDRASDLLITKNIRRLQTLH